MTDDRRPPLAGPASATAVTCESLRARIGEPEDTERLFVREEIAHLASCAGCRESLARIDPASLFALLALDTQEEVFWNGFETRVLAEIREGERRRTGLFRGWLAPRWLALAAGASLMTAVAFLAGIRVERDARLTAAAKRGLAAPASSDLSGGATAGSGPSRGALAQLAPGAGVSSGSPPETSGRAEGTNEPTGEEIPATDTDAEPFAGLVRADRGARREGLPATSDASPAPRVADALLAGMDASSGVLVAGAPALAPVESILSPTARIISIRIGANGSGPTSAAARDDRGPRGRAGPGRRRGGDAQELDESDVVLIVDQRIDI